MDKCSDPSSLSSWSRRSWCIGSDSGGGSLDFGFTFIFTFLGFFLVDLLALLVLLRRRACVLVTLFLKMISIVMIATDGGVLFDVVLGFTIASVTANAGVR